MEYTSISWRSCGYHCNLHVDAGHSVSSLACRRRNTGAKKQRAYWKSYPAEPSIIQKVLPSTGFSPKNAIIATEGNKVVASTLGQEDYPAIVNQSDSSVASIDDVSNITYKEALLLSVKLSDERHFTQEEWKDILTKIESGEIKLEAE
ncbi:hypothetical protein [Candidatus Contubernalis alkaliaceticus]|uniref:hypothetical protein n=1 Tax=Candidatus Contubernalis alkaliaceticus TaxID=338645 RepID=UPI001F4C3466|nr:hypothetical protein [Candidatus Contubernalis alkalaceticus]UNC92051.1 hypothetical protein HUE98_08040 [Candidatus Contubernalis alkalaceticus]